MREAFEGDPQLDMRGFVCAHLGILPNDRNLRRLTDEELVFIHYYLRKKQAEEHLFALEHGPKIIGRALGTYWSYESLVSSGGPVHKHEECDECGNDSWVIGENQSGHKLKVCRMCHAPWPVQEEKDPVQKPSEIILPLGHVIRAAFHSKSGDFLKRMVRNNVAPPADFFDTHESAPSVTQPGSLMMDSAHSTPEEFMRMVETAKAEAIARQQGAALNNLDETLSRVDEQAGRVVKQRTDQDKESD